MVSSIATAVTTVVVAAEEAAEGAHSGPNHYLIGGIAFGILLLLLFITTRFNVDR